MALQIVNQGPPPEVIVEEIREAIAVAIEGAEITIGPRGPGHFEITVVSETFEGKSRVQQHQLVYGVMGFHGVLRSGVSSTTVFATSPLGKSENPKRRHTHTHTPRP